MSLFCCSPCLQNELRLRLNVRIARFYGLSTEETNRTNRVTEDDLVFVAEFLSVVFVVVVSPFARGILCQYIFTRSFLRLVLSCLRLVCSCASSPVSFLTTIWSVGCGDGWWLSLLLLLSFLCLTLQA